MVPNLNRTHARWLGASEGNHLAYRVGEKFCSKGFDLLLLKFALKEVYAYDGKPF
ncbi:hypothetical protein ES703_17030 [subsurface metagenome]